MAPDVGRVLVYLVAGVINHHLLTHEGDCEEPCCIECCAPCSALSYLRTSRVEELAEAFRGWDTDWDWCNPDGTIKWELSDEHWGQRDCREYHERGGDML